jgi:hypothetical protein
MRRNRFREGLWMALPVMAALAVVAAPAAAGPAVRRPVDDFETAGAWRAMPAEGVEMELSTDSGRTGRSLRVDFRFVRGGGYAVVHREVDLALPENYRFRFAVRGECRPQNLEFKLIDSTGANVWWSNQRDFAFRAEWDSVGLRRRHIGFAWGPAGGGEIRRVAAIEFAITAGGGGEGTVWLDDLTLEELPPPDDAPPAPVARASSSAPWHATALAADGDTATWWACGAADRRPWFELDLGAEREFGGLVVDWVAGRHARDYDVEFSADGARWRLAREVRGSNGGRDPLLLPESEARRVRLRVRAAAGRDVALREVEVRPLEFGADPNAFYLALAREAPRGTYPRGMSGEMSYWTVVGAEDDTLEGLISEDGVIEAGKGAWSIEPFLHDGERLYAWSDAGAGPGASLVLGAPVPRVTRAAGRAELEVTALAAGPAERRHILATYRVSNRGDAPARFTLFLAVRPFQVNPPPQFLNTTGGATTIHEIVRNGGSVRVDGRVVACIPPPDDFGALAFDAGEIVSDFLARGAVPGGQSVRDPVRRASAALAYHLELGPRHAGEISLAVPLRNRTGAFDSTAAPEARVEWSDPAAVVREWGRRWDRVSIALPDPEIVRTLRAQLGWILVNRDGPAIQPGSRSYDRSWIRDGSLTSSALLRLGQFEVVREYLEWFANFQFENGRVPCCVDARGADPVPEHDSHGQFIFLAAEYFRYSRDTATVAKVWPHVLAGANAIDALRQERRGPGWRTPENLHFFGLLPPSISHEGYSAKPMHSYWDDLFALRGLKDAAWLARVLKHEAERRRLSAIRDEFARDLAASVRAAMAKHAIDYVPGCADLGDFDATSTTVALNPVQAADAVLPRAAVAATFERYWRFFTGRRDGREDWEAYTPYELRNVGAFVRLGWRDRAHELLDWFMKDRRPAGWAQWAEVVWKDERAPRFIGDMPHTWVGSDFVRSVLDMLAYPRERDDALVIGAGVPPGWLEGHGVSVRDLPTPYGPLAFSMLLRDNAIEARVEAGLEVPRGGVVVLAPARPGRRVTVNGRPAARNAAGEVVVRSLPATVRFER